VETLFTFFVDSYRVFIEKVEFELTFRGNYLFAVGMMVSDLIVVIFIAV